MKIKLSLAIAGGLVVTLPVSADQEQLPTITIEGSAMRTGTFGTAPDSSGLKDTASLLERVPGANVNRNGPLTGIASYRGLFGNRINVSIDGANMKEVGPNSMDPPLSHIPAPLTGKLTVYQGISPVSSGIESFGGSMHASSKKGRFAEGDGIETSGTASMGYGSVDDGHYGVLLGAVANKNHKLYLSGSKEQGRDYKIRNNQKQVNSRYDREAFTTGYGYQRHGHEFNVNYSNNNTGNTGTPALPMDIEYIKGGLYDASYKWDLGQGYQLRTNLFYQKMRHLMSNSVFRMGGTAMMDDMSNRTKVEAGGLDLAFDLPFYNGILTLGINGDQANHDGTITMIDTSSKNNGFDASGRQQAATNMAMQINFFNRVERDRYSFFTEWSGRITDKASLDLGARYVHTWSDAGEVSGGMNLVDRNGNTTTTMTDRMAFNKAERTRDFDEVDLAAVLHYAVNSELDINFGLGRKNRAPTYQELYLWTQNKAVSGFADGNTYLGNLDLKLETAYQIDLGFDWHTDDMYVVPRFFYHYIDNYIQGLDTLASDNSTALNSQGIATGADLQWSNIEAQLYGVDMEIGYTIDDNWRLDGGLNYVRGEQINAVTEDTDLYRIPPLNGRTQLTYEQAGWMGAIEGVFYANQGDVAGYNQEQKTKGYMLLNLRGQYEPYQGLIISTGVENVMDIKHYNHLGGYQNHDRAQGRVAMPGRNLYATLSYNW